MSSVELRGGLHVNAEALALAVALEMAEHALTVKDGKLMVNKGSTLTAEERAAIQRLRFHLMALAVYEVPA